MKYINVTEENFKNLNEVTEDVMKDIRKIIQYLQTQSFLIGEESNIAFCNHLVMMLYRFQKKELATVDIDESVISQLQPRYMEMARALLTPFYEEYNLTQSLAEEVLLAIYFQTNMEKEGQLCQTSH